MTTRTGTSFEERVGLVLAETGFITDDQLAQARAHGHERGGSLLDNLMTLGIVARETLVTVLSFQLRIPIFDLKNQDVDSDAVRLVPEGFAKERRILPVGFEPDGSLRVATLMPNDFQLSTQLSSMTGRQTKFALALSGDLDELIERTYARVSVQRAPQPEVAGTDLGIPLTDIQDRTPSPVSGALMGHDIAGLPAAQVVRWSPCRRSGARLPTFIWSLLPTQRKCCSGSTAS